MNRIFWALVIVGLLLLIAPFFGLPSMAATILWLLGGLLVIGAVVWAVVALARAPAAGETIMGVSRKPDGPPQ